MSIDISTLSLAELDNLQKQIEKQKRKEADREENDAIRNALSILKDAGAKVNEADLKAFFTGKRVRKTVVKAADPKTATHYNPNHDKPKKWFNVNAVGANPLWFRNATPEQQKSWELTDAKRDALIADGSIS